MSRQEIEIFEIESFLLFKKKNRFYNYEKLESMSKFLESKTNIKPIVGIICGSGLGNIAQLVQNKTTLSYNDIPDFPRSTGMLFN